MTVIAASLKNLMMASDSRMNIGDANFPCQKIFKIGNMLVGAAGTSTAINTFFKYLEDLQKNKKTKRPELDAESELEALVMDAEGIYYYEHDCVPTKILREYHAIGCGGSPALAALMCGKNPEQAVRIACRVNTQCGLPVNVLKL